jgi:hypothetical protein
MTTPLNNRLDQVVTPYDSATRLVKMGLIVDSNGLRNSGRWVGHVDDWDVQHVGAFIGGSAQDSVGTTFEATNGTITMASGAGVSCVKLDPGDAWPDANTEDHINWSRKWYSDGAINPNFQNHGIYGLTTGNWANSFNLDTRKTARVILRDAASTYERVRVVEHRGGSNGTSYHFGRNTDSVEFDQSGELRVLEIPIRAAGALGSLGGSPVGVAIQDSNDSDSDRGLEILGALVYNSAASNDFPSTGLIVSHTGHSGWSAYDHLNNQSDAAKTALIEAHEGFDVMMICLGHNAEDSGTKAENYKLLAEKWAALHIAAGYSAPDFIIKVGWAANGSALSREEVDSIFQMTLENGHAWISDWDFYEGLNPEVFDPARYSMDLNGVHPDNSGGVTATAKNIALDIEWHWQPENIQTYTGVLPGKPPGVFAGPLSAGAVASQPITMGISI